MSAKYKSPSFLLPNELNTSANTANDTGINSLYSMDFDGSNDFIDAGNNSSLNITSNITLSVWVKPTTAITSQNFAMFVAKGINSDYMLFSNSSTGTARMRLGSSFLIDSVSTISTNVWTHIVGTYDGSNLKIYLNGSLDNTVSQTGAIPSTSGSLQIGAANSANRFNGQIDEVAIFNRALNTTEIAALYDGTGSNIRPSNLMATNLNPIAYYPLGEQAQNTGYLDPSNPGNDIAGSEWQFPNGVLQDYVMDFGSSVGKFISLPNEISLSGEFAMSFWLKPTASNINLLGNFNNTNYVYINPSNQVGISSSDIAQTFSSTVISSTSGNWQNLLITRDSSNVFRTYVNGDIKNTVTDPGTFSFNQIGRYYNVSTNDYRGEMSNVAIWNTDQSANKDNIYNNGSPQTTYTVTPQNWWKLNATSVYTPSAPNYTTALDFVANGDTISIPDSNDLDLSGTDFSISFWVNANDISGSQMILQKYSGSTGWAIYNKSTANSLEFYQAGSFFALDSNSIDNNIWSHYVVTANVSASEYKIYKNGSLINTISKTINITSSTQPLYIGSLGGTGFYYNGLLSNIAIFNSTLLASQVSTLFNFGTPETAISFSPVSWWKLDNTTTGLLDSGSASNNGTNSNPGATQTTTSVAVVPSWKIPTVLPIPSINYSKSLDFDPSGSGDYISFGNRSAFQPTSNYTFSIWFNADSSSYALFGTNSGRGSTGVHALLTNTSILYHHGNQSQLQIYHGSLNTWHNFTVTWSSSTGILRAFIDGKYVTQKVGVNSITWSSDLEVGRNDGWKYDGELSNFAMWDTALTDGFSGTPSGVAGGQVAEVYNAGQPQANITGSPVGWWKLDDQNTITDYSGNNYTGTNNGAVNAPGDVTTSSFNIPVNGVSTTLPSTALQQSDLQFDSPYSNYSLSFDGTGDYIDCGNDSSLNISGDLTLSAWINVNDLSSFRSIISKRDSTVGYEMVVRTSGEISFYTDSGQNSKSTATVSLNTWTNIIITVESGVTNGTKIYFNGVADTWQSGGTHTIVANTNTLSIGRRYGTTWYFNGNIDETSIFNYALSSAQVLEIYNNGRPKDLSTFSGTAPISWWRLGENAYFDNNSFIVPNSITGAPNGTGSGSITTMISADAPGTYANGVGTNLDILDRVGDAPLSTSNSQSYNMIPSDISPYVPQYAGDQIANNFSMSFDGVNDFIDTNQSLSSSYTALTLSAWVNYTSISDYSGTIFGQWIQNNNSGSTILCYTVSNKIQVYLGPSGTSLTSTTTLTTGTWYNVILRFDGSTMKLYINGTEEASAAFTAINNSAQNLILGAYSNSAQSGYQSFLNGKIDEVAIFDTALNAGQIYNDIYQPTATATNQTADLVNNPNLPNPVAWYRMGD